MVEFGIEDFTSQAEFLVNFIF